MANKTQRKPAKRSATKPTRVAVAPGGKKVSARKGTKAARPAKKAPVKKAAPKKPAPKKTAPRKAPKKAPPPAPKPVAKVPAKAVAPVKKAAPEKAAKPAKPETSKKAGRESIKEPAASAAVPKGAARAAPPAVPAPGVEPELLDVPEGILPDDEEGWAEAAAIVPPVLPVGPRKRGRKRRDPLDDLLSPDKPKRGRPGRPRKRSALMEVIPPKRARLRKRLRARRSGDGD